MIQQVENKENFLQNITSIDNGIMFTVEDKLLSIRWSQWHSWSPSLGVYRKLRYTDQYLQWYSHYHIATKYSVLNTLTLRNKTFCSISELLITEQQHLHEVLFMCKYLTWTLNRMHNKSYTQNNQNTTDNQRELPKKKRGCVTIFYTNGLFWKYHEHLQQT